MAKVIYSCINCSGKCTREWEAPEVWHWQRRSGPKVLCPKCGGACFPDPWREVALAECQRDARLDLRTLELGWSACPNVSRCFGLGHYARDCEEALPVRPKCLAGLYSDLESLDKRLCALERKAPARRVARCAV